MEDVRYAEDVKDTITLANRLAKKANHATVHDRDYFLGLLLTHRKFNKLDGLLGELKVSPSRLKKQLFTNTDHQDPVSTDLLKNAERIAAEPAATPEAGNPAPRLTVDVEHLLKALSMSSDPIIQQIVTEHQISPERINDSLQKVNRRQGQRTLLYVGKELVEVVVFVLVFLVLIKSFFGELRLIPSESMLPGLQINDRLVIERMTRWVRPYQRGDVLVFYPPMTQLKNDPWSVLLRLTGFSGLIYKKEEYIDVAYIKRLIGMPGDLVNVKPGYGVFVNGKMLNEPYVNEIANSCTRVRPDPVCGPVKVPPHSYYMMGDNRNLSLDSRYWGFAAEDRVIGRAVFRIWPLNRVGALEKAPD